MTPRERAEAATHDFIAWDEPEQPEITQAELIEVIEAAITEHVRALLADDETTIEAMAQAHYESIGFSTSWAGLTESSKYAWRNHQRAALVALRRKALGE